MVLVERQQQLTEIKSALRDAASGGAGGLVVVTGEAGAGKTALVRRFAEDGDAGRVLWGICDDLLVPRPLGPFRDIAAEIGGVLEVALRSGEPGEVPDALLEEMDTPPRPVVLVVEDAHWADEATLDVLRFLGRRIERLSALMILTYRPEEVPPDHPLRAMLGVVPASATRRIGLPPLTLEGVAALAGSSDVEDLHRITGGNPLYVTEMLNSPSHAGVPPTIQEVVMARVGRLSDPARRCVETASVIPLRIELWLLTETGVASGIDEAARLGVLVSTSGDTFGFSHEVVRRAIGNSLGPSLRAEVNARVLEALVAHDADPARLTHHAVEAGDAEAVARFAPAAARAAASLGSHRESVAHFRHALHHPDAYPSEELGGLYYDYAYQCYITERHTDAASALRQAIAVHEEMRDQEALGRDLFLLAEVQWHLGSGEEAAAMSERARSVLEPLPPSLSLAWVYAQKARMAMVDLRHIEAVEWGEKAVDLGRRLGGIEVLVHALTSVGSARWLIPPFDNRALLEALEMARTNRLHDWVGRTYANLVEGYLHFFQYPATTRYLDEGLAFCEANDLVVSYHRLVAHRSSLHLEQGRWAEAESDAQDSSRSIDVTRRILGLTTLGLLEARRGGHEAEQFIGEAEKLAEGLGDAHYRFLSELARVELAWLNGNLGHVDQLAATIWKQVSEIGSSPWMTGEAALWAHRAGVLEQPPSNIFEPHALHINGRWEEAAAAWEELGRPYAQADALADSSQAESLLRALEILNGLGAKPRAAMVRRRLMEMGVTRVPRSPRPATLSSPAGLTPRQTEVLRLLADGLTYREIAERLYISTKTVDHHVSAVRLKLGVTTRKAAVEAARRLGVIDSE